MNSEVVHQGVQPLILPANKITQSPKKFEKLTYVLNMGIITIESILYQNDDFGNILGNNPTLRLGMCEPSEDKPVELLTIWCEAVLSRWIVNKIWISKFLTTCKFKFVFSNKFRLLIYWKTYIHTLQYSFKLSAILIMLSTHSTTRNVGNASSTYFWWFRLQIVFILKYNASVMSAHNSTEKLELLSISIQYWIPWL